ncbi:MAG: flippase [Bacteroidetes bacterium]|nr:MAG: flippase [Bacteroidota bacterium]
MKQSQRIVKNITVMLSSQLIGIILNFFSVILIARYLGVIGFGKYSFIIAFVGLFQMIADSGLSNIMVREVAVNTDNLKYQLGVTKSLIWVSSIIVFLIIVSIINIINPEANVKNATYIMGMSVLAAVHTFGYNAIFKAMEVMEYNAVGFMLHKFLLLSLIVIVINLKLGLIEIAVAYLISDISLWFFYYLIVRHKYFKPRMIIDLKAWWFYISEAIPVGIASLLRKISWQVDILILSAIGTPTSVGIFSAPYRIIQGINVLPYTLSITLFPLFSRLAKTSSKELFQAYEKSLKFMYLLSIPIVVILTTFSYSIVSLLFGVKFINSYVALQILSFTIIFLFPAAQFIYLFSALGKQRLYTISSFLSLAVNIILDLILIPKFDFIGACIGTLIAEILLFSIGIYYAKSIDKNISFIRASWKPVVSGILMWTVLYQFRDSSLYWMLFGVFVSIFTYILSIIILKTFSKSELYTIKEGILFLRKTSVASATGNETK